MDSDSPDLPLLRRAVFAVSIYATVMAIYFAGVADTQALKWVAFWDFLVFVAILAAGYVYLYRAGAFDWSQLSRRARRLKSAENAAKRAA